MVTGTKPLSQTIMVVFSKEDESDDQFCFPISTLSILPAHNQNDVPCLESLKWKIQKFLINRSSSFQGEKNNGWCLMLLNEEGKRAAILNSDQDLRFALQANPERHITVLPVMPSSSSVFSLGTNTSWGVVTVPRFVDIGQPNIKGGARDSPSLITEDASPEKKYEEKVPEQESNEQEHTHHNEVKLLEPRVTLDERSDSSGDDGFEHVFVPLVLRSSTDDEEPPAETKCSRIQAKKVHEAQEEEEDRQDKSGFSASSTTKIKNVMGTVMLQQGQELQEIQNEEPQQLRDASKDVEQDTAPGCLFPKRMTRTITTVGAMLFQRELQQQEQMKPQMPPPQTPSPNNDFVQDKVAGKTTKDATVLQWWHWRLASVLIIALCLTMVCWAFFGYCRNTDPLVSMKVQEPLLSSSSSLATIIMNDAAPSITCSAEKREDSGKNELASMVHPEILKVDRLILSPRDAIVKGRFANVRQHPQPVVLFYHSSNRAVWKLRDQNRALVPGRYAVYAKVARKGPSPPTRLYLGGIVLGEDERRNDDDGGDGSNIMAAREYREFLDFVEIAATGNRWDRFRQVSLGEVTLTGKEDAFVVVANAKKPVGVDFKDIFLTLIHDDENDEVEEKYEVEAEPPMYS